MFAGSRAALVLSLLVLLGAALAGNAAAGHGVAEPQLQSQLQSQPQSQPQLQSQPHPQLSSGDDGPTVTMVVDLRSDGNARWHVSAAFNLTTDADRAAFEDLGRSFEDGETSALGLQAFRRASADANEVTDREMSIVDVDRDATVENDTGRLTVAFTWTNFARTDGERLHVDSVLATGPDGETWLPGLDAGDRLVVRAPEGYGVAAASTAPERRDNRSVLEWTGPETFEAADLQAEFTGQAALTPTGTPTPGGPEQSVPWPLVFVLGLGGGAVVAYLLVRSRDGIDLPPGSAGDGEEAGVAASADSRPAEETGEPEPDGTADAETDTAAGESDETLLSDEERVERLLDRNGGRMKQATIVKETGWSNAKVSQLLSSMEEEGRIDKLRIGRENLISYPDEDIAEFEE